MSWLNRIGGRGLRGLMWMLLLAVGQVAHSQNTLNPSGFDKSMRSTIVITETVPLGGSTASFTVAGGDVIALASAGPMLNSDASSTVPNVSIKPMVYASGTKSSADIIAQAKVDVMGQANLLAGQLWALITEQKYKAVSFVYTQQVQIESNSITAPPPVASYSCPTGYVLSGTTCSETTTQPAIPNYSCASGYTLSGSTCTQATSQAATPIYSCASGYTLSGSTCTQTVSSSLSASISGYSCPSGYTLSGSSCTQTTSQAATPIYSCASGSVLSGSNCLQTTTSSLGANSTLSCPSGGTLSGTSCITTTTSAASVSYSCSSGTLSGSSCTLASTQPATTSYSCASGSVLSGSNCLQTTTTSIGANSTLSCPSGGTLIGTSCITTTTSAVGVSYYCSSGTLSGATCISSSSVAATATVGASFYLCSQYSAYSCTSYATYTYGPFSCNGPKVLVNLMAGYSAYGTQAYDRVSVTTCGSTFYAGYYPTERAYVVLDANNTGHFIDATTSNEYSGGFTVYSCPSGYAKSGSNCTQNTTTSATASYSCPSGGTLSGSTCTATTTSTASVSYSCSSGATLVGSTCTQTTTSSQPATTSYSCSSGYTLSGSTCTQRTTTSATASYSCPSGGTLSGTTCTTTATSTASVSYSCSGGATLVGSTCTQTTTSSQPATTSYSCSSGFTLSGSACTKNSTQAGTPNYSCPSGATLVGSTCTQTATSTQAATLSYVCSNGSALSGTSCTQSTSQAASISGYSCPSGSTLSGSSCTQTTSQAATPIYSCASGQTLVGNTCTGVINANSNKQLVWSLTVQDNGKATWGIPQILDSVPSYLYMVYTPQNVAAGLPSTWGALLSNAGQLQWQLRKVTDNTPVTSWVSVQTMGAFDGIAANPDFGPNCLAQSSYQWTSNEGIASTCPQGYPTAQVLISQYSVSSGAIIDYIRQLQPVYTTASDGTQTGQISVQVTERNLALSDCNDGILTNQGIFGAVLNETMDRYFYDLPLPAVQKVGSFNQSVTPPTTPYKLALAEQNQTKATLQNSIINPFSPTQLIATAAIPYLVPPVPPLTVTLADACAPYVITSSTLPSYMVSTYWPPTPTQGVLTCTGVKNQFTVDAGQLAGQCHGGSCNSSYVDAIGTFTQGTPGYSCQMTSQNYKGYLWNPVCIEYDGANTVSLFTPTLGGGGSSLGGQFTLPNQIGTTVPVCNAVNNTVYNGAYGFTNAYSTCTSYSNVTITSYSQTLLGYLTSNCWGYGGCSPSYAFFAPGVTPVSSSGSPIALSEIPISALLGSTFASLSFTGGWGNAQDITNNWATMCPGP